MEDVSKNIEKKEPAKEKQNSQSSIGAILEEKISSFPNYEEKLKFVIDSMKDSLSKEGSPDFRTFWESKKFCLTIFKEDINPVVRSKHWQEYLDLSIEAKRLKEILNEKSIFALKQLKKAVESLEQDIENFGTLLQKIDSIKFSKNATSLLDKQDEYDQLQKELTLLNAFATRINSLRKELVKTDMRIRIKSEFFKILSSLGDKVFPRRKDLIKLISEKFCLDIEGFVKLYFVSEDIKKAPFYVLKNEIKALQNIAKLLTLNTKAFTETRSKLSKCWDKIKEKESVYKDQSSDQIKIFKENAEKVSEKINEFEKKAKEISIPELEKSANDILDFMDSLEIGRYDSKNLEKRIDNLVVPIKKEEQDRFESKRKEELEKKQKSLEEIKKSIKDLIEQEESLELDNILSEKDSISEKIKELSLNKMEKQILDRLFKPLKDVIANKKEAAILNLSEDELQSLDNMKKILKDREKRKFDIKQSLEKHRKSFGVSSFDFEQAMMLRKMMDLEKQRLEDINLKIGEIKENISQLEG